MRRSYDYDLGQQAQLLEQTGNSSIRTTRKTRDDEFEFKSAPYTVKN
jgi:hypothetical protein